MLLGQKQKTFANRCTTIVESIVVLCILVSWIWFFTPVKKAEPTNNTLSTNNTLPVIDRIEVYELCPLGRLCGVTAKNEIWKHHPPIVEKFEIANGTVRIYLILRDPPKPVYVIREKHFTAISNYGDKTIAWDGKKANVMELEEGEFISYEEFQIHEEEYRLADYLITDEEVVEYRNIDGKYIKITFKLTVDDYTFYTHAVLEP